MTLRLPFAVSALCKSTYPKDSVLHEPLQNPRPARLPLIAPRAPPSGKLLRLVNDIPFKVPESGATEAATMITLAAAFPFAVRTEKLLPFSIKPTDCPLALPPLKRAMFGLPLSQVKEEKLLHVSAAEIPLNTRIRSVLHVT